MSEHNQHYGHDPHDPDYGQVESSALSAKPILAFLAVLFIATTFVFFVVKGLDWGFRKLEETTQGQPATQVKTEDRKLPPEPLLQGAPGKGSTATSDVPTLLPLEDMEQVRKSTDEKIASYGWVDQPGGIARVPIDRAKAILAEKGLPSLPSPTISEELQKAETVRKEIGVAGSNAGRMISVQKPPQQPVQQPTQQPAPRSAQPQRLQPQQVQPHQH
ncbi:MAG: hypothetical protein ACREA2_04780 [Blastocatellia bacterium]